MILIVLALFHHACKPLDHLGVIMREEGALLLIQCGDRFHIVVRECEVEDIEVLAILSLWTDFGMTTMSR